MLRSFHIYVRIIIELKIVLTCSFFTFDRDKTALKVKFSIELNIICVVIEIEICYARLGDISFSVQPCSAAILNNSAALV